VPIFLIRQNIPNESLDPVYFPYIREYP